jgi:hypothetical protein
MKTTWELNCHTNVFVEWRYYFLVKFVEIVDYFDAQGEDVLEFMMQMQHSSKHTDRRTQ